MPDDRKEKGEDKEQSHQCTHSQDRIQKGPADYFDIIKGDTLYKDPEFPIQDAIRWDDKPHASGSGLSQHERSVEWKRVRNEYTPENGYSLWGGDNKAPSLHDIRQGQIGDCWFLAAASALAEIPDRLEKVFINEDDEATKGISHNGIYAINMYALMMPVTLTIDDRLPMKKGTNRTLYANVGRDKSVWGPLYEKAFAKYHGSYEALVGGNPEKALNTIAGAPGRMIKNNSLSADDLWDLLRTQDMDRAMITMGCFGGSSHGIVGGHAYSFIRVVKLSNGTRLVQVRNPWSVERYKGPWGDSSSKWTDKYKKEANFEQKDDGVFFTTIDIFRQDFGITWINYDTYDMFRTSWMKLDDKTNNPGKSSWCGSSCTRHDFTLKSRVKQTVIVSASAW